MWSRSGESVFERECHGVAVLDVLEGEWDVLSDWPAVVGDMLALGRPLFLGFLILGWWLWRLVAG